MERINVWKEKDRNYIRVYTYICDKLNFVEKLL